MSYDPYITFSTLRKKIRESMRHKLQDMTVAYWHSWGECPFVEVVILDRVPRTATFAEVHERALQEGAMRAATRRAPLVTGITPIGEAVAYHLVMDGAPVGTAVEAHGFDVRPATRIDLYLTAKLPDEPMFASGGPGDHMTAHLCALRAKTYAMRNPVTAR